MLGEHNVFAEHFSVDLTAAHPAQAAPGAPQNHKKTTPPAEQGRYCHKTHGGHPL